MGIWSAIQKVGLLSAVGALFISTSAAAQTNYDPEYDDETAAGAIDTPATEATEAPAASPTEFSRTEDSAESSADTTADEVPNEAPAETKGEVKSSDLSADISGEAGRDEEIPYNDALESESPTTAQDGATPLPWAWGGARHFSSMTGPVGLFHVYDAESDEPGTFGLGLHGAFFKYSDYLIDNDENVSMWGGLNLRVTPIKYLEVFAGLEAASNSNTRSDPQLIQTLGEFNIGLKGMYSPIDLLSLGIIFGLEFHNPVGEVGIAFDGLTYPLGVLATVDFSKLNKKIPLRAHLNAIYRFDNSAKLVDEVENQRGGCGEDVNGDGVPDYDGCLDAVERKGLDIDRTDQMQIALGVDAAFPFVTPLIEYGIDIPINRQDFVCPLPATASRPDSCMNQEGGMGMRQFITIGVRVLPPINTLSIDLGVDIGLSGYAPSVHELAPQAPYRILFGLTYAFDPFVEKSETKEAPVPAPLPAPEPILPQPVISGYVHDAADSNSPVAGASVRYLGLDVNAQLSDDAGKFDSYSMPEGPVTLAVRAHGYEDASFTVNIPDPRTAAQADASAGAAAVGESLPIVVPVDCPLVKKVESGVAVIVVDGTDGPLAGAMVEVSGPAALSGTTNSAGEIRLEGEPGRYTVVVRADGYFERERVVEVAASAESRLSIQLTAVPAESSVELSRERISIKKRVMFKTGSDEIAPESHQLLDEVANVLRQHPEVTKVEIQGHTDNRGSRETNLSLSDARARAVAAYLVSEGIRADRLTAKGYGSLKPRAPNITSSGRAKNRRVEFHILERAE